MNARQSLLRAAFSVLVNFSTTGEAAQDLAAVIDFYNERFGIGLTANGKADLVSFLGVL